MDDLQEIKSDVKEILQRTAVHNELLRTHEARSIALQQAQETLEASIDSRLDPIEDHVKLLNRVGKVVGAIIAGLVVQLTVKKLLGLF